MVMKFPPTLFSHQQNKYFPGYERQQFNLVARGAGNWFRDTELFTRTQRTVDETMRGRERKEGDKYSGGIVISYKYL